MEYRHGVTSMEYRHGATSMEYMHGVTNILATHIQYLTSAPYFTGRHSLNETLQVTS